MAEIPVFHMASFSRSGETVMLRTLNAHSRLKVVHQILEPDDPKDMALFRHLCAMQSQTIDSGHETLAHRDVRAGDALVLKNAVWEHEYPYRGFIFVRNPFAVMLSAKLLDETTAGYDNHKKQCERWGKGIDKRMVRHLLRTDNLTAFCMMWNRKMTLAHATGLPIVHYERFVADPERMLRKLAPALGVEFEAGMLKAHENYQEGQVGHGHIKLWQPIHAGSLDKYKRIPDVVFDKIYAHVAPAMKLLGYHIAGKDVSIPEDFDCRFPNA